MADPSIPDYFRDAVDNPAYDDQDPLAPFDPTSELNLMKLRMATTSPPTSPTLGTAKKTPKPTLITPEDASTQVSRIVAGHNALYQNLDSRVDDYVLPPARRQGIRISDAANFLFGDELGAIGIKLDSDNATWNLENAMQQWSEHPYRTTIALASWALPGLGAIAKSKRVAKMAGIGAQEAFDSLRISSIDDWYRMTPDEQYVIRSSIHRQKKYADLQNLARYTPEKMSHLQQLEYWFHKNFAHKMTQLSDPSSSIAHTLALQEKLDAKMTGMISPFLATAPPAEIGPSIALYHLGKQGIDKIPAQYRAWAEGMSSVSKAATREAIDVGFLDPAVVKRISPGEVYVPLLPKKHGLPVGGPTETITVLEKGKPVTHTISRLTSPALLERSTGMDEFVEMIKTGEALTDPKALTLRGLGEQVMLLENHKNIVEMALDPRFGIDAAKLAEIKGPLSKMAARRLDDEWVPIFGDPTRPGLPNSEVFRRMIAKKKGVDPSEVGAHYLSRDAFDQIFGPNGMIAQSREAVGFLEAGTRIHKTAVTALNAYTHGQNLAGTLSFLSMRGFRLLTGPEAGENWNLVKNGFLNLNSYLAAKRTAMKTGKEVGAKLRSMKVGDRVWSAAEISDELNSPYVREVIEEGAFLAAEGTNYGFLSRMAEKAESTSDFLAKAARTAEDWLSVPKRFYNAEDSGPKFAYYMKLRSRGFTRMAAAEEVARALPVYRGIAEGPKLPFTNFRIGPAALRKWMFPWISFPAEAMRLTKNNLMDNPLRMIPWLHSVNLVQTMLYGGSQIGIGEPFTFNDYMGIRRQLPIHAQRPMAVVTPFTDQNNDIRAAMLDFIPFSSFMPRTLAEEAPAISKIPVVSPEDAAPILTGMINIMTGRGPFGQEISATSTADKMGKHIANFVGFFTPPYIRKYLFDITGPRGQEAGINTYKLEQDLGLVVNPQTGKPGSWLGDFLLSTFVMKNYPASGEQELFNKTIKAKRTIDDVRGELTRRFNASIRSNRPQSATDVLEQVAETFVKEYGPGPTAQQKFSEWVIRHRRSVMRHPQLQRFSEEELIRLLIENNNVAKDQRSKALDEQLKVLRRELIIRQSIRD